MRQNGRELISTPSATPDVNHSQINTLAACLFGSEAKTLSKTCKKNKIQRRESERSRGSADTSTYGDTDKNRGREEAPAKYKHHTRRVAANSSHTHAPLRPRSLSLVHAVVCTLQWPGPHHSPTLKRSRGQSLVALSHVWVWGGKKACDPRMKRKKTKRDRGCRRSRKSGAPTGWCG